MKPTGNGRRESYKFAPMPRMRATHMLPGPHSREEIIASVNRGLYCDNFTNGQVNIGAPGKDQPELDVEDPSPSGWSACAPSRRRPVQRPGRSPSFR